MSDFGLEDAKELVRLITEKSGNTKTLVSGVVMIAPIFCRSFKIDDIVKATGFRRNQVERAALNLWRYGIWTNDDGWVCDWGRLFAGDLESLTEEEFQRLGICFILDVLVAEGLAARDGAKSEDFRYWSLEPN